MAKSNVPRVLMDSSALLSIIKNESGAHRLDGLLRMIQNDEAFLVQSVIVLGEVFKVTDAAGVADDAHRQKKLTAVRSLVRSRKVLLQDVSLPVIDKATEYRLTHNMKLFDAIHLATAILHKCDWLVTLDRDFKPEYGIKLYRLEDVKDDSVKLPWESEEQEELFTAEEANVIQFRK